MVAALSAAATVSSLSAPFVFFACMPSIIIARIVSRSSVDSLEIFRGQSRDYRTWDDSDIKIAMRVWGKDGCVLGKTGLGWSVLG